MTDRPINTDREFSAAIFGDAPLQTIASRFASRTALMQFYAGAISHAHPATANLACEFCAGQTPIEGFYVVEWMGTVRMYWVKIIAFSSIFLPVFVFMLLLPFHIIPHLNLRFGEEIRFETHHPLCRECWRRQRIRQILAFLTTLMAGFVLAISFLVAAITGALAIACLGEWWGYKSREALDPALIFFGAAILCIISKAVINKLSPRLLLPLKVRRVGKKPFGIAIARLVRSADVQG